MRSVGGRVEGVERCGQSGGGLKALRAVVSRGRVEGVESCGQWGGGVKALRAAVSRGEG